MSVKKKCLVVDDSDVIRKVARHIIESIGFAVDEAADGETAIQLCETAMPDVLLVDWHMLGMSGQDVILAVRQRPGGDKATIIYCTTENEAVDIARALSMGANDYLMKPFDRQSLTAKLVGVQHPASVSA